MNQSVASFPSDDEITQWLNKHFQPQKIQLEQYTPYEKVFQVFEPERSFFIKLLPNNFHNHFQQQTLIYRTTHIPTHQLIAYDRSLNLLAYQKSAGISLQTHTSPQQFKQLLTQYAQLQLDYSKQPLPSFAAKPSQSYFESLLQFLRSQTDSNTNELVSADFFITPTEAQGYAQALGNRQPLLNNIFEYLDQLPQTLCHGHLLTQSIHEGFEGKLSFGNWEHAFIAPAGSSLFTLFGGCQQIAKLLDEQSLLTEQEIQQRLHLEQYIQTLEQGGYAHPATLKEALPLAAFLGVLNFIPHYAHYAWDEYGYKKQVGNHIRELLESLIHFCDFLSLKSRSNTLFYANDYVQNHVPWRAISLLQTYQQAHPNDIEIQQFIGDIALQSGDWATAIQTFQHLSNLHPQHTHYQLSLGHALLKDGQYDLALRPLEQVLKKEPEHAQAQEFLAKAKQLHHWREQAKIVHLAPTLRLSNEECNTPRVDIEHLDLATEFFRQYGNVVIENIFPIDLVKAISKVVFEQYENYFEDRHYDDNLILGDKRRMVTLELTDVLNSPEIYGAPIIRGLMQRLLDTDYVMGGMNAVVSLPHAKDQGLHKDYPPLFPNDDPQYHVTPPFAIAILTPLIDMTEAHGTTEFRKGSHLVPEQMPHHMPTQTPVQKMGDCVVFDYRTAHEGLANLTDEVRPMLCIIFHRVWFRDALNYNQQADVLISPEELQKVPEELKHLFKWVKHA